MKDYFDGNIKAPQELFLGLCFLAIVLFSCSIVFILVALFYDRCEDSARVLLILLSVLTFVTSIGYPVITIHVVKNREEYPCLAKLLVKPDRFTDKE